MAFEDLPPQERVLPGEEDDDLGDLNEDLDEEEEDDDEDGKEIFDSCDSRQVFREMTIGTAVPLAACLLARFCSGYTLKRKGKYDYVTKIKLVGIREVEDRNERA